VNYNYKIEIFPPNSFLVEEINSLDDKKWIWTDMEIGDMLYGKVDLFGPESRDSLTRMIDWLKINHPELTI
jgi:hypothetical protein